MSLMKVINMKC